MTFGPYIRLLESKSEALTTYIYILHCPSVSLLRVSIAYNIFGKQIVYPRLGSCHESFLTSSHIKLWLGTLIFISDPQTFSPVIFSN
jgi:hypothetical protein